MNDINETTENETTANETAGSELTAGETTAGETPVLTPAQLLEKKSWPPWVTG